MEFLVEAAAEYGRSRRSKMNDDTNDGGIGKTKSGKTPHTRMNAKLRKRRARESNTDMDGASVLW
jgi:hypothetical protein